MNVKEIHHISEDPIYSKMFESGSNYTDLVKSGWLNTGIGKQERIESIQFKTLSVDEQRVKEIMNDGGLPTIIFSTGSYAPMHEGHIESIVQSYEYAKNKGMKAIKIVISPSHDVYTTNKNTSTKTYTINKRLEIISNVIDEYFEINKNKLHIKDLIHIDLYESKMNSIAINFSDVLIYLQTQLQSQLGEIEKTIQYAYVFGQDNSEFSKPFQYLEGTQYHSFCVARDDQTKNLDIPLTNKNSHFIVDNTYRHLSSTQIRQKNTTDNIVKKQNKGQYFIRDDSSFTLAPWIEKYPKEASKIKSAYKNFILSLENLIKKHSKLDSSVEFFISDLETQKEIIERYVKNSINIINIDSCTNQIKGQTSINYSRIFELGGLQNSSQNFYKRNGFKNSSIEKNKKYYFADDDISSGSTMRMVEKKANHYQSEIIGVINLTKIYFEEKYKKPYECFDVVDTRDFLIGSFEGGLLCNIGDKKTRFPYISPFVNLKSRANIEEEQNFSKDLLEINKTFYQECSFIKLDDIFIDYKNLFLRYKKIHHISELLNTIQIGQDKVL